MDVPVPVPPPVPQSAVSRGPLRWLMPVVLLAGVGGAVALSVSGGLGSHSATSLMFPVLMIASTLATVVYSAGAGLRNRELDQSRDDYLSHLDLLTDGFTGAADRQRAQLHHRHPSAAALWTVVDTDRRWRYGPDDADFGQVRIGVGAVSAQTRPVVSPQRETATGHDEPVTTDALRRFLLLHQTVECAPVAVALTTPGVIAVCGDRAAALVRAMVCQLAVWHHPEHITIAVVAGKARLQWDWVKWLPHNVDGGTARPMFYHAVAGLPRTDPAGHIVAVVDRAALDAAVRPPPGVTLLVLGAEDIPGTHTRITVDDAAVTVTQPGTPDVVAEPDLLTVPEALACARRLAAHRRQRAERTSGWLDQIGIADAEQVCAKQLWQDHSHHQLRIPIGTAPDGSVVELDINEAAANGMGPHGLCVGATGSGKSELLRAIALGMIACHSPETLNLILVDFKGGATFLDLESTRHVAAVITNLSDEAHLVERMQDALAGEMHRRQQLLRTAGNISGISDYRRARAADATLPPLPALFVIVDEFSELLTCHPDFIDTFVAIGRLGRSLGMHLLLASQRLDEGRLRGLDSHLSYRICLKTLSATESRAVLGVPDAYELPTAPGAAFLKSGPEAPVRFQSAFVSGPVGRPAGALTHSELFTVTPLDVAATLPPEVGRADTVIDVILDGVAGQGPPAHPVWLAPLDRSPTLGAVLADVPSAQLVVPIGLADRVFEQRREPVVVDLTGAAGNVAVVGAPQSGKTTTLRTLILALAAGHHPRDVAMYCLDFGGGLSSIRDLPHVGAVAGRRDADLVVRIVHEITALARRRETQFAGRAVDSIADYRRRRSAGDFADDPYGDVFLVIDGWSTLRHDFDGLESSITSLAVEGLSLGIHIVLSASRWADLRPALKDQIGTRIELRLGDPVDSEIDRKRARNVPATPGRGLTADGSPLTVALPRLDGGESSTEELTARFGGTRAPTIAALPVLVGYVDAAAGLAPAANQLLLGLDERRLHAVTVDFGRQAHLLILGDSGCGKTSTLRTLCKGLAVPERDRTTQVVVIDPRRSLADIEAAGFVTAYASTAAAIAAVIEQLADELGGRVARRSDTPDAEPGVYLLVDDFELLGSGAANPMAALLEALPYARDIGLHIVLARRSAGAARALYEPVLSALRELDPMTMMMSSALDEGLLLGTARPRPLPPGRATLTTRAGGERLVQVAWCAQP